MFLMISKSKSSRMLTISFDPYTAELARQESFPPCHNTPLPPNSCVGKDSCDSDLLFFTTEEKLRKTEKSRGF